MKIAVIGLGKIGLPLAVQYATKGHDVVGIDVSQSVVDVVNRGRVPFPGEAFLDVKLAATVDAGLFTATTDYGSGLAGCDAIVVVVPLFVDEEARPDFGWMDAATESIAANLPRGALVAYETTLPVGTTRERWAPRLEAGSGLVEGIDFDVVFSPERVLTGRVFADLRRYPKLVGGLTPEGAARGVEFYESVLDFDERDDLPRKNGVWDLGTAEAAEMAKLAETTYRDVNIGLANEFARYAEKVGVDVQGVIEACNSQPYSHIHSPGIAVGGHCIPVYPRLYLWNDPDATIVRAARARNAGMPHHAVDLLARLHGDLAGQTVLVLGAAYRGGVKETAFSGVFDTVRALESAGADVVVHDPMYKRDELARLGLTAAVRGDAADAVIVQADHADYRSWTDADVPGVRTVVDGRRLLDAARWAGCAYVAIGGIPTGAAAAGSMPSDAADALIGA